MFALLPRSSTLALLVLSFTACGGTQSAPASGLQDSYPEGAAPPVDPKAGVVRDETPAEDPNAAADPPPSETIDSESPDYVPLDLVYRVSPDGLRVQLEGIEFVPEVEAIKMKDSWGVKLSVSTTVEGPRVLLSPESGPLAFGGVVNGRDGYSFADKRQGEGELALTPEAPATFSRTWPAEGEKGIVPGQELELHVGLWGFGLDAETRTPIRRFVVVKMRAYRDRATPQIQPPKQ